MKPLKVLGAHSPELLIGFGLAGMVISTVLAIKATPKAMKLREEELRLQKMEGDEDISPILQKTREVISVLPAYVPTIVIMVASSACIIGGSATSFKRNAALATALHVSEAALVSYQDKVVEEIGEEKAKKIKKAVMEDDIRKYVIEPQKTFEGNGKTRCYDRFAGREFWSDKETLRAAALELNEDLFEEDRVTLNDFYYKLGLRQTDIGSILSWDISDFNNIGRRTRIIELTFDAVLVDGVPYMSVGFKIPPTY